MGFSEESHSDADFEYTYLDHVWVSKAVVVDNNGTPVDTDSYPRYEEGAEIGSISITSDETELLNTFNQTAEEMVKNETTAERMRTFGSRPAMLRTWVIENGIAVPKGELLK